MPKQARADAGSPPEATPGPRVLKKYPNRRLYDTRGSSYITLAAVREMVLEGEPFEVRDAKSGDDLTRSILLQIILEQESGGVPIFSTPMLAQLIRFYGHAMHGLMGQWLERNLHTFAEMQQRLVGTGKGLADTPVFHPEAWASWLQGQPPALVPGMMGDYMNQSAALMAQMQDQMARQAAGFFGGAAPVARGATPQAPGEATSLARAPAARASRVPTRGGRPRGKPGRTE